MGDSVQAVRMSAGELGCTYAALILHDDGLEISEENLKTLLNKAGVVYESYWPSLYAKMLSNNDINELIAKPSGGGGGGAVAAAAGGATGGAAGGAGDAAAEEEEDEGKRRPLLEVACSAMMAMTIRH